MFNYKDEIETLPAGIDRALLRILTHQVGRGNATTKPILIAQLLQHGIRTNERAFRAAVAQLRKQGHLICSAGGPGGGYWLAANWGEVMAFINTEIHPRAMDLLETESILKKAARDKWGEGHQLELL